jgi:hypothetical protein
MTYCPYCHGHTTSDRRGNCAACGAGRMEIAPFATECIDGLTPAETECITTWAQVHYYHLSEERETNKIIEIAGEPLHGGQAVYINTDGKIYNSHTHATELLEISQTIPGILPGKY